MIDADIRQSAQRSLINLVPCVEHVAIVQIYEDA